MHPNKRGNKPKVAIVGAGLAGLTLAKHLEPYADITILEKSRGVGGRMATRYFAGVEFDHGAPFFRARSESFKSFLQPYLEAKVISPWTPRVVNLSLKTTSENHDATESLYYLAAPKMTSLAKALASELDTKIELMLERRTLSMASERKDSGLYWSLLLEETNKGAREVAAAFDWVVLTCPAPQTYDLLPRHFSGRKLVDQTRMQGCYSLMVKLADGVNPDWDIAYLDKSPIRRVCRNNLKSGRKPEPTTLVVHADNAWTQEELDAKRDDFATPLKHELKSKLDLADRDIAATQGHLWRYAATENGAGQDYLLDTRAQLAVCGDWCLDGHVESAFTSAQKLADNLKPLLVDAYRS